MTARLVVKITNLQQEILKMFYVINGLAIPLQAVPFIRNTVILRITLTSPVAYLFLSYSVIEYVS